MNLRVLIGPAQSGKITHAIESVQGEGEILIVCATAAQEGDFARAYSLRADTDSVSVGKRLRVQSFASLTSALWSRWGDKRVLVGQSMRHEIITSCLEDTRRDEISLPVALNGFGGTRLLAALASASVPNSKSAATSKYEDTLRSVLESYHQKLEARGYIEHQFAIFQLAKQIRDGDIEFSASALVIAGFADFSPGQLEMVTALAKKLDVTVVLDFEEGNLATGHLSDIVKQLCERGGEVITGAPEPKEASSPALRYLQSNFLLQSPKGEDVLAVPELSSSLAFGKAQGRAAEVSLLADFAEGEHTAFPFEGKALLVPSMMSYVRPLTRELERRGVPYELDVTTSFGSTGFGAALIALLRLCVDDDAQASASAFVLSGYSGLSPDDVLDLLTRWRRKRYENWSLLGQLVKHESGACAHLDIIKRSSMSARIGDWFTLITKLYATAAVEPSVGQSGGQSGGQTGGQTGGQSSFDLMQEAAAQKAATQVLQELYEQSLAASTEEQRRGAQLPEGSDQSAQPVQLGQRILRHDPLVSARDILTLLEDVTVSQTPRPSSTAVLIAEPRRVYGRRFHSVIVGGLSAADSKVGTDAPLDLRLAAHFAGTQVADPSLQQHLEHYSIIAAAREKLYLVAQSESLSGEEIKLGEFLTAVESCVGETACAELCQHRSNEDIIAAQSSANGSKRAEIRDLLCGKNVAQVCVPVHGAGAQFDLGFGERRAVSPSTLEPYAFCAYKWFLERFVQGEEVEQGFDSLEQGKFVHALLKDFYVVLRERGLGERVTEGNVAGALALYEELFEARALSLRAEVALTAAEEQVLAELRHQLAAFVRSEVDYAPEFVPTYLEYELGAGDEGPIDVGFALPLKGRVDRIDVRADDGAAIIVDYKRTAGMGGLAKQASNGVLQGVLYWEAAKRALEIDPVAYEYRSYANLDHKALVYGQEDNPVERPLGLRSIGRRKPPGNSEAEMEEGFAAIMATAGAAAEGLLQGRVVIRDEAGTYCKYCPHDTCANRA